MDLSGILGLLNPINWVERGWTYFRRPKLRVYFDADETFHTRIVADLGGAPGFFCHLMVSNDGKQTARNCQGRLIEVCVCEQTHQSAPHPDFLNPVVLKWAHEVDFGPRDIDPDLPRRLDLCFAVQSMPEVLRFFTPKIPTGNRTDFPPGTYRVKVRVDAENAAQIDGVFLIHHPGVWDQVRVSERPSSIS